ncbi:MAG: hypothetical protein ACOCZ6_05855 [Nanoarchaeota archaeon]
MDDMNEFIARMETSYQCSDFFRQKMRETVQRAFEIENDSAAKLVILNRIEETYARHAQNQESLNNLKEKFVGFNEQTSFGSGENKMGNLSSSSANFDLSLD